MSTTTGQRVSEVALALGVTPEKVMDVLWSLGVAVMSPDARLTLDQAAAAAHLLKPQRQAPVSEPVPPRLEVEDFGLPPVVHRPMEVPEALRGRVARLFEVAQALSVPVADLISRLPAIGYRRPADHLTQLDTAQLARLVATFSEAPPTSGGYVQRDVTDAVRRRRRFTPD